jgi:hypothetical protein
LKRIIVAAAVTVAIAALGIGVTVGSTRQGSGSTPATQTAAPQGGQTWDQRMCEQAAQQLRAKHPDAYIGGCNHGDGTITSP